MNILKTVRSALSSKFDTQKVTNYVAYRGQLFSQSHTVHREVHTRPVDIRQPSTAAPKEPSDS